VSGRNSTRKVEGSTRGDRRPVVQHLPCSRSSSGTSRFAPRRPLIAHVKIRKARASEAEVLSALALQAKAHWGYSLETLESWKDQLRISSADVASRPTYVGAINADIVGFYSLTPSGPVWELDNLWVAPAFIHRGVGRKLITHALELAFRGGASSVTVDADPNAEPFYLSCGATRRGEVPAPIPGQPNRVRPQLVFNGGTS